MTERQLEIMGYLERFGELIERGRTILDAGCGDGVPVDQYLVRQGFAVNGIDASAQMIERARRNVPQGFYEVKDMLHLNDGEYCVDGVVSLRALLHIPREDYPALLRTFTSFMPNGGALLLTLRSDGWSPPGNGAPDASASGHPDGAGGTVQLVEDAGFRSVLHDIYGSGEEKHQVVLACS
ncbi:MAG TPA: class I SAM-dependent methyltransferase [Chloroflexota bacterium]